MRRQCVDVIQTNHDQRVDVLKHKAIELYYRFVKRLMKGHKEDYSTIMNILTFLNMPYDSEKDLQIFEYLINVRP